MQTCQKAWKKLNQSFLWKETQEYDPPDIVYAVASLHFGGSAGMLKGLKEFGFTSLADAMGPAMAEKLSIIDADPRYGMIQRMGFCLNGVGMNLGTGEEQSSEDRSDE